VEIHLGRNTVSRKSYEITLWRIEAHANRPIIILPTFVLKVYKHDAVNCVNTRPSHHELNNNILNMALRQPLSQLTKRASPSLISKYTAAPTTSIWQQQRKNLAAHAAPPVTQDATGSKGPTAMVFMNMGGPSTTDEVGDFLSRLFVRLLRVLRSFAHGLISAVGRWRFDPIRTTAELHRSPHIPPPNTKDHKTICRHWWRLSHSQMERTSSFGNVQDPR
jgi:hypothetical protein